MLRRLALHCLNLVYPLQCSLCQIRLDPTDREGLCPRCKVKIRLQKPPVCTSCGIELDRGVDSYNHRCAACQRQVFHFDRTLAACQYEGAVKDLIHRFKYQQHQRLKFILADALIQYWERCSADETIDALISVPMDSRKRNARGFNQSSLLAEVFEQKTRIPHWKGVLHKHRSTLPQAGLNQKERRNNIRGCFRVKESERIRGKRLLLIDDVMTTGFTLSECAKVLKRGGALSVTALVVAKGKS